MPRSKPMTFYPPEDLKRIVEELAAEDGRSAAGLLLKWVQERPEVQAALAGGGQ